MIKMMNIKTNTLMKLLKSEKSSRSVSRGFAFDALDSPTMHHEDALLQSD
jgi:hypothetical protein